MVSSLQGQTVGKYRIMEPLGRGGMARVYRGYHPQLDRFVAIKVLRPDLIDDDMFMARFRREAQTVAGLRHPNIVQVHDFDVEGEITYMVMELLDGDTLHTRLNDYRVRNERMPYGEMMRVLLDLLAGLAYAHEQGMVHRDIKPANVLLTRQGQVVLADFGIAQIVGGTRHTMSGALLGTLNYMSPEQGLKGISDERSDLYSVGVMFYEMLTRRPPYEADTPLAILMKHVNDPLPLPSQIDATIPATFERLVLKALEKRPEDRYQSAEEMASAVRSAAAVVGIEIAARVSLPLSFSTPDAPQESVSVYSGEARARLQTDGLIGNDTLSTQALDWTGQLAALKVEEPVLPQVSVAAKVDQTRVSAEATPSVISQATQSSVMISPAELVLKSFGLIIGINLFMLMLMGLFNRDIYGRGWPVILFAFVIVLAWVMRDLQKIWLLIPTGMLGILSLLLAISAAGNVWNHWRFSWTFLLLGCIGVIYLTMKLARRPDRRHVAYRLGRGIVRVGYAAIGLMIFIGLVSG